MAESLTKNEESILVRELLQYCNNRIQEPGLECPICDLLIVELVLSSHRNFMHSFGLGIKLRQFGDNADALRSAFENIKSGKLGLSVRASTASMNKELEKQNDIMLAQTLSQLYQGDAQLIQAMAMQGMPPELKEYYADTLRAKQALYKQIVQNFGHDDAARLIPVPSIIKGNRPNELTSQQSPNGQQSSSQPGVGSGAPESSGGEGNNAGAIPITSGAAFGGVPSSNG